MKQGTSMKGVDMELTKLEARRLIQYHHEVIQKIKDDERMTDNAKQNFITVHKDRIEELRNYA